MRKKHLIYSLIALALCLPPTAANAGLALLQKKGGKAKATQGSGLVLREDRTETKVLLDRVQIRQVLQLQAETDGTFCLGLPTTARKHLGPQGLTVRAGKKKLGVKRLRSSDERTEAWLAVRLKARKGQKISLDASWWQPHDEAQLYGYWRFALTDPLWTSGTYQGKVALVEHRMSLVPGCNYSSSQPDTEEEDGTRVYRRKDHKAEPQSKLTVYYKRSVGAVSSCKGGRTWAAVDGDKKTLFQPDACPKGPVWIDLMADCDGFGTEDPSCTRASGPRLDIGASLRTADGKARFPVALEGWYGPKRVWRKKGRANKAILVKKQTAVTRYRIKLPKGLPNGGLGEIWLARADLANSDKGARRILTGRGWVRAKDSCTFILEFQNPVDLRHVTLQLKPKVPPRKEWAIYTPCSNINSTYPFHEPFPHKHSMEELRDAGLDTSWIKGVDKHEHGHHGHGHKHFKRKHPDRIELDVHPVCIETRVRVYSPRHRCTFPRLHLVF